MMDSNYLTDEMDDEVFAQLLKQMEQTHLEHASLTNQANHHQVQASFDIPRPPNNQERPFGGPNASEPTLICPVCQQNVDSIMIYEHVEYCLSKPIEENTSASPNANILSDNSASQSYSDFDPVTMETFECPICCDDIEPGAGYRYRKCLHSYCGVCLEDYYTQLINTNQVESIKCPHPGCSTIITDFDLQFILSSQMYDKYRMFLRNIKINKDPRMRWCSNPEGCDEAVKRENESTLLMTCKKCDYEFCYQCAKPFHAGTSCADAAKFSFMPQDFRANLWKKLHTKECPNCYAAIMKRSGCNHITCVHCRYEFCWLCKKQYKSDHWETSGCVMYGSDFSPIAIAKKIITLPRMIAAKAEEMRRASEEEEDDDVVSDEEDLTSKIKTRFSNAFSTFWK